MHSMSDLDGFIWYDGEFVEWRNATTHVLTHSLHYGLGVFEGIRAYATDKGPSIFRLPEHVDRLFRSAKILQMEIPYSQEQISEAIIESIKRNKLDSAYIRPLCFLGSEGIGLRTRDLKVHVAIASWNWGKYIESEKQEKGLKVKVSSFSRHHVNVTMCRTKCSGHYVNSMLALREVSDMGYDEAILLDTSGHVAEGSGENIFIVRDNKIYTPQLSSCLDGITRATVFELAKNRGWTVTERPITRDEAYIADEVFFTGTAAEISAVSSIDNRVIGNGKRGPITTQISKDYFMLVEGKNSDYQHWMTYCNE